MNLTLVLLDSNFIRSKAKRLKLSLPKFEPHTPRGGFKLISNHQTITFVVITNIYFLILLLNGSPLPFHYQHIMAYKLKIYKPPSSLLPCPFHLNTYTLWSIDQSGSFKKIQSTIKIGLELNLDLLGLIQVITRGNQ